ncbi:MAG: hypothetical protein K2G87_09215, partial [Oscillospiraceae bacterium]|nr:hypothetical protein [Oscillospiraceae bacterium]
SLSLMVFPLELPLSLTLSLPCYAIPRYPQTLGKIKSPNCFYFFPDSVSRERERGEGKESARENP